MTDRPTTYPPVPDLPDLPQAVCREIDPELFFPPKGSNAYAVKRICARCPEIEACLAYALANDVLGVWGGTGDRERQDWRRRNRIRASALSTVSVVDARQVIVEPPSRQRIGPENIAHGTQRGLKAHHRLGLSPCPECLAAAREYRRELRERKAAA